MESGGSLSKLGVWVHSEAVLDESDLSSDDGDVLEDAAGGVPEVLVEDDAAVFVEAELGHADGADGLASGEFFPAIDHFPADVVATVGGAEGVAICDGAAMEEFGGMDEVIFDGIGGAEGFEGVVEVGFVGVYFGRIALDVLDGEIGEEVFPGFEAPCFGFGGMGCGGSFAEGIEFGVVFGDGGVVHGLRGC